MPPLRQSFLVRVALICLLGATTGWTQTVASDVPVLSLDEAIQMAVVNNRSIKIAGFEVDKSKLEIAEFKTKRLPSISGSILGSQLLNEVSFNFKEGAFGTFPATGPIPSKDTKITTPRQLTAFAIGQVTQPLSDLYKIQLGIHVQELNSQVAREKSRAERQSVIHDVKQAYFAVLQSESALEATEASVKQYQELSRVVLQRVSQQTALESEGLETKAKLANEQYRLIQLRNTLAARTEYLNDLLGRDIRSEFRTEQIPPAALEELELKAAQDRALAQRPEIKEAEMSLRQAEYSRRIAKADYIPGVGLAFNYVSPFHVDVLPSNVASIGLQVKWEPWDWGRRKDVVAEKKATENEARTQLNDVQSKVLMDVNSRFRKLEEAKVLIGVAQAARDASQQKLREVTNRYQQQAVLLSDLFRQQAETASASDDYQQALLAFWNARADFEKSLGEDQ